MLQLGIFDLGRAFLALTLVGALGLSGASPIVVVLGLAMILLATATFCAALNVAVDRFVYKPLRSAPRLVPRGVRHQPEGDRRPGCP